MARKKNAKKKRKENDVVHGSIIQSEILFIVDAIRTLVFIIKNKWSRSQQSGIIAIST